MASPFDYVSAFQQQGGGPFGSVMQGLQAGAQMAEMDQRRAALAAQGELARQKAEAERVALEQKAAEQAELQQLQQVPFEQMTQPQRLRLMQLTNSEVSRSYISRALDQMSSEVKSSQATRYGALVTALVRNPEIGLRNLRVQAEAETDPMRKKALEDAARIAEMNPLEAARTIHTTMEFTGDERFVKAGAAALNFLKNTGTPLYPEAPKPPIKLGRTERLVTPEGVEIVGSVAESKLLTPEEEQQKIRIAQASRPPAAPREPAPVDPNRAAYREVDAAGNVTFFNAFGQPLRSQAGAGKPSAAFERTTAQRKQMMLDIDRTIAELKDISAPGGLIEQSTGSGVGRLIDVGAGFVGQATPGAIAIGRLQPIADMVLKMVPRFEGPQSDKDTRSYKEAAGQLADATLPTSIRVAAAKTIVRLMEARKGQFVTQDMASQGVSPTGGAPASPYSGLSDDEVLRRLAAPPGSR